MTIPRHHYNPTLAQRAQLEERLKQFRRGLAAFRMMRANEERAALTPEQIDKLGLDRALAMTDYNINPFKGSPPCQKMTTTSSPSIPTIDATFADGSSSLLSCGSESSP